MFGKSANYINKSSDVRLMTKLGYWSLHAEYGAILKATQTKDMKLLVIRINKDGSLTNSYPCSKCWEVILKSGIREVWYSDCTGSIIKTDPCKKEQGELILDHWNLQKDDY